MLMWQISYEENIDVILELETESGGGLCGFGMSFSHQKLFLHKKGNYFCIPRPKSALYRCAMYTIDISPYVLVYNELMYTYLNPILSITARSV